MDGGAAFLPSTEGVGGDRPEWSDLVLAPPHPDLRVDSTVARLSERLREGGQTVAVAESLTGGQLCIELAKGPEAAEWFRGGVVAYATSVKRSLLGCEARHPVSRGCAVALAWSVREMLRADFAVATTGVGGPGPEYGYPAGTVWLAAVSGDQDLAGLAQLAGDPGAVVATTVHLGVLLLERVVAP